MASNGEASNGEAAESRVVSVLIAADSHGIIEQIHEALVRAAPDLNLLSSAIDSGALIERVQAREPDLLFLDLDMVRVDGLTILRRLGRRQARRTVVLASGTVEGGRAAWSALTLGARGVIPTRARAAQRRVDLEQGPLAERLRALLPPLDPRTRGARARFRGRSAARSDLAPLEGLVFLIHPGAIPATVRLLADFPERFSRPTLLVFDIPPRFLRAIGEAIDRVVPLPVRRVTGSERLLPGEVALVASRQSVEIHRIAGTYRLVLRRAEGSESGRFGFSSMLRAILSEADLSSFGVVFAGASPDRAVGPLEGAVRSGRLFWLRRDRAPRGRWGLARILRIPEEEAGPAGI